MAQVFDDLVVELLAMCAPTFGTGESFHAGAQSAEMQHQWPAVHLALQRVPEAWKEGEFTAKFGFVGKFLQVGLNHSRPGLRLGPHGR